MESSSSVSSRQKHSEESPRRYADKATTTSLLSVPKVEAKSNYCNTCGRSLQRSEANGADLETPCRECGASVGLPGEHRAQQYVPRKLFTAPSTAGSSVESDTMSSSFAPENVPQRSPFIAGGIRPGAPMYQGMYTSADGTVYRICSACGHNWAPSIKTIGPLRCERCGFESWPYQPQARPPVYFQGPQGERNTSVPWPIHNSTTQPPVLQDPPPPPTGVPPRVMQPGLQSTPTAIRKLPVQQDGGGVQMSKVSTIPAPTGQFVLPEQCLRCCLQRETQAFGYQPNAQGLQGGQQPPFAAAGNTMQGAQQSPDLNVMQNAPHVPPHTLYSGDPYSLVPGYAAEMCRRCCVSKAPDRPVVPEVPHTTPASAEACQPCTARVPDRSNVTPSSNRLPDSLDTVTLGGGGNEFLVVDHPSGKAERWYLLPSSRYNFTPLQGAEGSNPQPFQSLASASGGQPVGSIQRQSSNFPGPAQVPASSGAPGATGLQSTVQGLTQPTANSAVLYMRVPYPSVLSQHQQTSSSDATGSQLLRQAALSGLSQSTATRPALFVRLSDAPQLSQQQSTNPSATGTTSSAVDSTEGLFQLVPIALVPAGTESPQISQPQESTRLEPPVLRPAGAAGALPPQVMRGILSRSLGLLPDENRYRLDAADLRELLHLYANAFSQSGPADRLHSQQPEASQQRLSENIMPVPVIVIQNPANAKGNASQPTASQAAAPAQPQPQPQPQPRQQPQRPYQVSGSAEAGQQSGSQAPGAARESQEQTPEPAPGRQFMQGSLGSILATLGLNNSSPRARISEEFDSQDPMLLL